MSWPPSEFTHWPDGYEPASALVYARNELVIPTSPDRIWEWLVRARQWPHWYPNSWSVKILRRKHGGTHRGQLGSGRPFNWITFGLPITATVDPFDKPTTIGWAWRSRGWSGAAVGYHVWFIESQPGQCRVVTEETHFSHQLWLRRLSKNAIRGLPR